MAPGMFIACAILAFSAPLRAQEAASDYRPVGPWSLDYGASGCSANRSFSAGSAEMSVSFTQAFAPLMLNVGITGNRDAEQASELRLVAGNDTVGTERFQRVPSAVDGAPVLAGFFASVEALRSGDQPVELQFRRSEREVAKVLLGDFRQLLAALRTCQDDLYRGAGIDPGPLRRIAVDASPGPNEAAWVTTDDLPDQFRNLARPLTVDTRLAVNAEGRVSGCTIVSSSGEPLLDLQSCRVLTARARYRPARDAEGQPVETIVTKRVRWLGVNAH
jgi:hypothetical protein